MTFTDVLSQPPYPGANPEEVAEIFVDKYVYSDWETVWVQVRWKDASHPIFRFTTAERDPAPELWAQLKIHPRDLCLIKLGGQVAVTGIITTRQTAYDANSHAVSIQGVGVQWLAWRGSILHQDGNFPGGYVEVATKVLEPFGMVPRVEGVIDPKPFDPPAHFNPGESTYQFLERLAPDRKVILGGDYAGNIVLVGDRIADVVDELIEGENIKSCQCVIDIGDVYDPYVARGQTQRSDEGSPSQAAQQEAYIASKVLKMYSPLLTPIEHPVWTEDEIKLRALTEANWNDGRLIEATIVVYGWFTRSGALWVQVVGACVILNSPMTTLVGQRMAIRSATSTQDRQAGTLTTLDLVAPWLLNDQGIAADATGAETNVPAGPTADDVQSSPNTPAVTGSPFNPVDIPGQSGTQSGPAPTAPSSG